MTTTDPVAGAPTGRARGHSPRTLAAAALGYGMNGFDTMLVALSIPAIAAGAGVSLGAASALTSITLAAAVLGAPWVAVWSDRVGRRRGLVVSVLLYAVGSGLTGLADDYPSMVAARLVVGVGIGASFGAAMALAVESRPVARRGRATALVALAWQTGVLAAVLAVEPVLAASGWRGWFLLGALPAIVILPVLALRDPAPAPTRGPGALARFRTLVADRAIRRTTGAIALASSVQNFGYYGVALWLPLHRAQELGVAGATATVLATAVAAGTGVGSVVCGVLADRVGRRGAVRVFQLAAALAVPAFLALDGLPAVLAGAVVLGVVADGALGGFGVLIAEHYPRHARVTALTTLFNLGRGVGGFGPLALAALAAAWGTAGTVAVLVAGYLAAVVVTARVPEPGACVDD